MKQRFVVFDVETTGNSPKKGDKIFQIAAVVIEKGQITEKYSTFINPNKEIPSFIEELTGITNEMVKDAPIFSEVAPKIIELLDQAYFVAHNVLFDLSFIQEELKNSGYPSFNSLKIDTVELARILLPTFDSFKLNHLANKLSFVHENPHQADSDALVTAQLFLALLNKLDALPIQTIKQMHKYTSSLHSNLDEILYTIYKNKLFVINEDNQFFHFYKGIAIKKLSQIKQNRNQDKINFQQLRNQISHKLQLVMDKYEHRKGQLEMLDEIYHALTTNQFAIIEAGTGIGKTFAYLFPSVIHSINTAKPVVISTFSKVLQQQICEKDMPLLRKIFPRDIEISILKGRGNYLSLEKFIHVLNEEEHNYDAVLTILQILVWLTETETGDMDELNLPSGGKLFWEKIKYDDSSYSTSIDFYKRAIKKAQHANIIITNHAFLFNDFANHDLTLPEHDVVILDEAHHIESVASEQLGIRLSYLQAVNQFIMFGSLEHKGLINHIFKLFEQNHLGHLQTFQEIDKLIQQSQIEIDSLFRMIKRFALEHTESKLATKIRYRYYIEKENDIVWKQIQELILRINMNITELNVLFNIHKEALQTFELSNDDHYNVTMYFVFQQFLLKFKEDLLTLFFTNDEEIVTWIDANIKGAQNIAYVYGQYMDIGEKLATQYFTNKRSVIFTSATLMVNDSYRYFIDQLGLEYFYPICKSIPSPFDYKKQVQLMVPIDLPGINQVTQKEYIQSVSTHIAKIAVQIQGRILVLFTSHEMLSETFYSLKDLPELEDFMLIGQGISTGSRTKLTKSFQQFPKSILLGTNSFWEGIDFPGNHLKALIIVRLPFPSPEEPIMAAKSQSIKQNGENAFEKLSLPNAILRFKQGFGRLVRNNEDKGVVFVFDTRIVTKSYGKKFIDSIPEIEVYEEPLPNLLKRLEQWL